MNSNPELRDFLVSRRARLTPQDVGVEPFGGARRVPGLRREEVAFLAGVSIDYYTRFERGRVQNVSDEVLDAIARALRLDDVEQDHLRNLARTKGPRAVRAGRTMPTRVPAGLQAVLDAMTVPAYVLNGRVDFLAANAIGWALYPFAGDGDRAFNASRFQFLDSRAPDFYRDYDLTVRNNVAILRASAGENPHDPGLVRLVGELSTQSELFRSLWAQQDVVQYSRGTKRYHHPAVGDVDFEYETFEMPAYPGLTMLVYVVEPASRTAEAMQLLASWAAAPAPAQVAEPQDPAQRR
ncbi:helix-turn-helix transcriptional regulator [Cellulomonas sp. Y8]|uniref:helix-turn-helix transcriptional regulator n=1 Tax=Cellulomonas sp. Y8 TaxID=2591145 RepID=UPI003D74FAD9